MYAGSSSSLSLLPTPNQITAARAVLVGLVALLIGAQQQPAVAWSAVGLSLAAVLLDGVDGWVARRTGTATAFGARFDMEVDALLVMVLAVLVWQHDKAGAWVLLSGLLRYGFLLAGAFVAWMRAPLHPSRRRQTMCVVQIGALLAALVPDLARAHSGPLAAAALAALGWSFLIDVLWLRRQAGAR